MAQMGAVLKKSLLCLFEPEDEGTVIFRNVRDSASVWTMWRLRRLKSSTWYTL